MLAYLIYLVNELFTFSQYWLIFMLAFIWCLNNFLLIYRGMGRHTVRRFISLVNTLINIRVACLMLHHSFITPRLSVDAKGFLKFLIIYQSIHLHPDWWLDSLRTLVVAGWGRGVISVTASIRTHKRSTTGDVMQISICLIPIYLKDRERNFFVLNGEMWHILLFIGLLHLKWLSLLSIMYVKVRAIACLVILQSIGVVRDYL